MEIDFEQWRDVHALVARVYAMAPWDFMQETDLFGVEDPDSGELGFISVMGALGEHRAVAVYKGAEGLYGFLAIEAHPEDVPADQLLDLPHLQLSFENRSDLEREDRQLLASLGLKFKGRKSWPQLRSYRSGCFPWFLEAGEVRLLQVALAQLLEIAPRFKSNPSYLRPSADNALLIRRRVVERESAEWREAFKVIAPPEPEKVNVHIDPDVLERAHSLERGENSIEIDCFRVPTVVAERRRRPFFPYVLLLGDCDSGLLLSSELLEPTPSITEMWGSVPERILRQLGKVGWMPKTVSVRDGFLAALLHLISPGLGFSVHEKRRLPLLDHAKVGLIDELIGGGQRTR